MSDPLDDLEALARRLHAAVAAEDLTGVGELFDQRVTWGAPGARRPACTSRDQVLEWYRRALASGVSARAIDVRVCDQHLIVEAIVRGTPSARERGGETRRYQVLSVRDGLVVDIVGFDSRQEAEAAAEGR